MIKLAVLAIRITILGIISAISGGQSTDLSRKATAFLLFSLLNNQEQNQMANCPLIKARLMIKSNGESFELLYGVRSDRQGDFCWKDIGQDLWIKARCDPTCMQSLLFEIFSDADCTQKVNDPDIELIGVLQPKNSDGVITNYECGVVGSDELCAGSCTNPPDLKTDDEGQALLQPAPPPGVEDCIMNVDGTDIPTMFVGGISIPKEVNNNLIGCANGAMKKIICDHDENLDKANAVQNCISNAIDFQNPPNEYVIPTECDPPTGTIPADPIDYTQSQHGSCRIEPAGIEDSDCGTCVPDDGDVTKTNSPTENPVEEKADETKSEMATCTVFDADITLSNVESGQFDTFNSGGSYDCKKPQGIEYWIKIKCDPKCLEGPVLEVFSDVDCTNQVMNSILNLDELRKPNTRDYQCGDAASQVDGCKGKGFCNDAPLHPSEVENRKKASCPIISASLEIFTGDADVRFDYHGVIGVCHKVSGREDRWIKAKCDPSCEEQPWLEIFSDETCNTQVRDDSICENKDARVEHLVGSRAQVTC